MASNDKKCVKKKKLSCYVEHNVEHCQQQFNWDCGVTCVMMLLSAEDRQHFVKNFHEICEEEGFGQSTWSIDLCYLLKRYGINSCLYTTTLGVNEDHKNQKYYDKIFDKDRSRILFRFEQSPSLGIRNEVREVSCSQLEELVRRTPVIVLVDAGLLLCDLCKFNKLKIEFRRMFGGSYTGHYILLVGYHSVHRKFLYRNPALPARLCAVSYNSLLQARSARGTDHDIIALTNYQLS